MATKLTYFIFSDYDLHDINDSGISLNEYETHSELTRETPLSGISKSVRFEDEERIGERDGRFMKEPEF